MGPVAAGACPSCPSRMSGSSAWRGSNSQVYFPKFASTLQKSTPYTAA
jgi:hypothetical protein